MAPMSNKERQAAFRAKKKLQPFADKHFEGMHVATLEQFLYAVEVDREQFLSRFPPPSLSDPRDSMAFKSHYWDLLRSLTEAYVLDPENSEQIEELGSEVKRRLHAKGYFAGLPEYRAQFQNQLESLVQNIVGQEADRLAEEWLASPEGKKEIEDEETWNSESYAKAFGEPVTASPQYPLYQLIAAYKEILALP